MFHPNIPDIQSLVYEILLGYQVKSLSIDTLYQHTIPTVVIAGTATVGKSSLINALFGGQEVAIVSPTPQEYEHTRRLVWSNIFHIVDSPSHDQIPNVALEMLNSADIVVHVYDKWHRRNDQVLAKLIEDRGIPALSILNKCDQYTKNEQIRLLQDIQTISNSRVLCVSAKKQEGLAELITAILQALPSEKFNAISHTLLEHAEQCKKKRLQDERSAKRKYACDMIMAEMLKEAAQLGADEKPFASIIPLIKLWELMQKKIEEVYREDGLIFHHIPSSLELQILKNLTPKTALQELSKFLPAIGPLSIGSIAGAGAACDLTREIGNYIIKMYEDSTAPN